MSKIIQKEYLKAVPKQDLREFLKLEHDQEVVALFQEAAECLWMIEEQMEKFSKIAISELYYKHGYFIPIVEAAIIPEQHGYGDPSGIINLFDKVPMTQEELQRNEIDNAIKTNKRSLLLRLLLKQFYWTCVYCQRTGTDEFGPDGRTWHIDHGYPKALGGDNDPDNLILACATCNISKGKKTATAVLQRILDRLESKQCHP